MNSARTISMAEKNLAKSLTPGSFTKTLPTECGTYYLSDDGGWTSTRVEVVPFKNTPGCRKLGVRHPYIGKLLNIRGLPGWSWFGPIPLDML